MEYDSQPLNELSNRVLNDNTIKECDLMIEINVHPS
jgi:hypothetical protein